MSKKSLNDTLLPENTPEMTYEKAISRIEEIASILDKGDVSVDESLLLFEESVGLIAYCNKKLDTAEHKITNLSKEI